MLPREDAKRTMRGLRMRWQFGGRKPDFLCRDEAGSVSRPSIDLRVMDGLETGSNEVAAKKDAFPEMSAPIPGIAFIPIAPL